MNHFCNLKISFTVQIKITFRLQTRFLRAGAENKLGRKQAPLKYSSGHHHLCRRLAPPQHPLVFTGRNQHGHREKKKFFDQALPLQY